MVEINGKSYKEDFIEKAITFYTELLDGTFEKKLQKEMKENV